MPRDDDALRIVKWASNSALLETPESQGLTRAIGFPESYGIDVARRLQTWQQQLREVTALLVELAQHGGPLPWHASQRYDHPARVTGSDGELYRSTNSSGGDDPSRDPVGDVNNLYWEQVEVTIPVSSTTQRGIIEMTTRAEALAGEDEERAVVPADAAAYVRAAIAAAPRPLWL